MTGQELHRCAENDWTRFTHVCGCSYSPDGCRRRERTARQSRVDPSKVRREGATVAPTKGNYRTRCGLVRLLPRRQHAGVVGQNLLCGQETCVGGLERVCSKWSTLAVVAITTPQKKRRTREKLCICESDVAYGRQEMRSNQSDLSGTIN